MRLLIFRIVSLSLPLLRFPALALLGIIKMDFAPLPRVNHQ